jgi:hypothetical protein
VGTDVAGVVVLGPVVAAAVDTGTETGELDVLPPLRPDWMRTTRIVTARRNAAGAA